jgi:hypothetical protein
VSLTAASAILAFAPPSSAVVDAAKATSPNAGAAPTVWRRCTGRTYWLIDPNGFPTIRQLRTYNLPRLTDGYAPRCLVAETIASIIQTRRGRPGRFRVGGARWYAGVWVVRRTIVRTRDGGYAKYTGTHGRQRVTFNGFS